MKIFSVYDEKATAFLQPFFSTTPGTAIRSFEGALQDETHQFCRHAGDYTLFEIGDFNENNGFIQGLESFGNLGNGLAIKAAIKNNGEI